MANYSPVSPFIWQFGDGNRLPLSGGSIEAYLAGTTTPTPMYTDNVGTSAGATITLNARGEPEVSSNTVNIWTDDSISYKFVLKDSAGASIWTTDNISKTTGTDVTAATIADLRSLTPGNLVSAYIQGYYAAGDGGAGHFYWDASATESDDGGSVILPTGWTANGRWKRIFSQVTPQLFGAIGNGSADDSVFIQAAIDYVVLVGGGTVFIPEGTYSIETTLDIDSSGITLRGEYGKTLLQSDDDHSVIVCGAGTTQRTDIHIVDLEISSSVATPAAGIGIIFNYCLSSRIDRCHIHDCYEGVSIRRCEDTRVTGTRIKSNEDKGITVYGNSNSERSSYTWITNCSIQSNGDHGVLSGVYSEYTYFDNSETVSNGDAGFISAGNGTNKNGSIFFRNSVSRGNTGKGLEFTNTNLIQVTGAWSVSNTGIGVNVASTSSNGLLSGSRVDGNGGHGVYIAADNVNVTGCDIAANSAGSAGTADGVYIHSDATDTIVGGCRIHNKVATTPQRYGVNDNSTSTLISQDVSFKWNSSGAINGWLKAIPDGDTGPNVRSMNAMRTANTGATTISNFIGGREGQRINIIVKDANTTFDFTGSNLKGNGGANLAATLNDSIHCVYDGTNWYCTISNG